MLGPGHRKTLRRPWVPTSISNLFQLTFCYITILECEVENQI